MKNSEVKKSTSSNPDHASTLKKLFPIGKTLRPLFQTLAPELEVDEDIVLKSINMDDARRIFDLVDANRKHLEAWLSWIQKLQSVKDSKSFIRAIRYKDVFAGRWVYGIYYQDQLVGMIDFNDGDRDLNQVAIGYWLSHDFQGKGIVTRAARKCIDYLFKEKQVHRVLIKCATDNYRSQAVANRLNFNWEGIDRDAGTVNGKSVDMINYGILYREWLAMNS
ncbi:MAG: GNAT family N-acetyltransferase [Bacteroidetes bacterium]|nr:GNAT family N-acetyltransferase [Bacteroidota bacterium]MCB0844684.1 GNAT family N-acetyltransferase [Bacteroidota bacterium]MCB0855674.1 GNAT family N-acetyltransferase [Bacteroidota bacterium]